MFNDMEALAELGPGSRVLELGPGTGQATLPLARRGYQVLAIELGAHLAAVARRNLAPYPAVEVVEGAFEGWPLAPAAFDLVFSATAFHWVDPAIGYAKAAAALRPGGALALCWNRHVQSDADRGVFDALQACYVAEAPEMTQASSGLPTAENVAVLEGEAIDTSGHFEPAHVRRYRWDATYTATTYTQLLATYSNYRRLPAMTQARLFDAITRVIDTQFGGAITMGYLTLLYVARRRAEQR
jgi:SAM-dependent methyltransferase